MRLFRRSHSLMTEASSFLCYLQEVAQFAYPCWCLCPLGLCFLNRICHPLVCISLCRTTNSMLPRTSLSHRCMRSLSLLPKSECWFACVCVSPSHLGLGQVLLPLAEIDAVQRANCGIGVGCLQAGGSARD